MQEVRVDDPNSKVSQLREREMGSHGRGYSLLENLGTEPNVLYLKKVEKGAEKIPHG